MLPFLTLLFYNAAAGTGIRPQQVQKQDWVPGAMQRIGNWSTLVMLLLAMSSAEAVTGGGDIIFPVPGMASVLFSHEYHVSKIKLRCSECHYGIYSNRAQHKTVGMAAMEKGKSCGACHDGKKAFGVADKKRCASCHSNPVQQ